MIQEGIYYGSVWHKRGVPLVHQFKYKMLMVGLELQKIEQHLNPNTLLHHNTSGMLSLRDSDHFPDKKSSLQSSVTELLPNHILERPHKIFIVTQLAHFGFAFNPISFFIITSPDHVKILGLILEVHNTPWGERHYYPLFDMTQEGETWRASFKKELHVSPFMSMDYRYEFSMLCQSKNLKFTMNNWQNNQLHFQASIVLKHHNLDAGQLRRAFWRHLLSPQKTVAAIYWQAAKLWLKRAPFYSHPKSKREHP